MPRLPVFVGQSRTQSQFFGRVSREDQSRTFLLQLREDAFEIINALCASDQMFAIKDDSRNTADTLVSPEFLFSAYRACKSLIREYGLSLITI